MLERFVLSDIYPVFHAFPPCISLNNSIKAVVARLTLLSTFRSFYPQQPKLLLKRNKCQHFAIFLGAAAAGPLFLVFIDTILVIEAAYTATGSSRSQTFAISFTSNKSAQANEQALDRMQLQCYGLKDIRPLFFLP